MPSNTGLYKVIRLNVKLPQENTLHTPTSGHLTNQDTLCCMSPQGTTKAVCTVYLWDYHEKVVVTDIDGTITRSDVAGHVLPLVGMDWTQNGVV